MGPYFVFWILTFLNSAGMAASPTPSVSPSPGILPSLDFAMLCSDQPLAQPLIVIDNGFCHHYLEKELLSMVQPKGMLNNVNCGDCEHSLPETKPKDRWKIRFYASHSFTTYFTTNVKLDSSRYKLEVKDYVWAERSSREYFKPETWAQEGNNPLQMIDEPSNTFTVSIEKDGHEFFLSAFHPKYTLGDNSNKFATGTIDGVPVNGPINLNTPFHGYVNVPGESKLVRNENTHRQMQFEVGYGYRFKLLDSKKMGSIHYVPSVGTGVMVGQNYSAVVKPNEWWEFDEYHDPLKIQGAGVSLSNRIEYNTPRERFGLFYENKLNHYQLKHGFLDGTQSYHLQFMNNSVGMKFMLFNPKRKKTPPSQN